MLHIPLHMLHTRHLLIGVHMLHTYVHMLQTYVYMLQTFSSKSFSAYVTKFDLLAVPNVQ